MDVDEPTEDALLILGLVVVILLLNGRNFGV